MAANFIRSESSLVIATGEWLSYGHNYKSFTFGADT